jgi:hypothetical protein
MGKNPFTDLPPVRTDHETYIEIDQAKGKYPFLHVQAVEGRWAIVMDANEGGAVIGEGQNQSMLRLSNKRMRALRDFLNGVDLGDGF